MRINELLEGVNFKDLDFVKKTGDKREIDFDLPKDLIHFMNNNDEVYRRHTHPAIMRCTDRIGLKRATSPEMFKPAVLDSYKIYIKKFPIRELPVSMDNKMCTETCKTMHDEVIQHIKDGKYKD